MTAETKTRFLVERRVTKLVDQSIVIYAETEADAIALAKSTNDSLWEETETSIMDSDYTAFVSAPEESEE